MAEHEILRRASYGATSPIVGQRGSRTRARIVAATLALFEEQGFHRTSVDDISKAARISRATLYQYFGNKEEIFVELLEECGTALMRVVRRIGPLGSSSLGFDNLHWWLGEWAWVYDKYATMFVQWASVDPSGTSVSPLIQKFEDSYNERIAGRLTESGMTDIDPLAAATVLTALVQRFNFLRHKGYTAGRSHEQLLDGLAVVVQLVFFPDTPPEAFAQVARLPFPIHEPIHKPTHEPAAESASGQYDKLADLADLATGRTGGGTSRLSERAVMTVRQLVDAGARAFGERGYHGASMDDILKDAGFARGTYYKYFGEKLDLLVALAQECEGVGHELQRKLARIPLDSDVNLKLRGWLLEFMAYEQRYAGVTRCWFDGTPEDPRIKQIRRRVHKDVHATSVAFLRGVARPYPFDVGAASVVLFALLERLPGLPGFERREELAELIAVVIERGLLNGKPGEHVADVEAAAFRPARGSSPTC